MTKDTCFTMNAPPDFVVEAARLAALQSPCAKSKRGVVLFNREQADRYHKHIMHERANGIVSRGFNGQPRGFQCTGSASCREHCAKLCMHAEQRAIFAAGKLDDVQDLELVHVKVVDGVVVAGGGPSCWQCSRLVVESGLRGVWLYEAVPVDIELDARGDVVPTVLSFRQLFERRHGAGVWRFYDAKDFHRATIEACGIAGGL